MRQSKTLQVEHCRSKARIQQRPKVFHRAHFPQVEQRKGLLMSCRLAVLLLCLSILPENVSAENHTDDRELMQQIVTSLNRRIETRELERRDLTITVNKGVVTVAGRIEDANESHVILRSIVNSNNIRGIQLNLGIGREPLSPCTCAVSPKFDAEIWRRPLSWDDGDWHLNFGTQSIRQRTK